VEKLDLGFLNSFYSTCEGGSSGGGSGGSHSNAGPGEGKDVVELTEANFRKKVINSEKVSLGQLYAKSRVLRIRYVYPGSRILLLFDPGSRSPDPTRTKRGGGK
jgi:hypothetical protein